MIAILAAAVGGGWFAINSWLKSGNLDASIKTTLSDALGTPVDFESLGFVPFTRVALHKLTVANPDKGAAPLVTCRQIELGLSPVELIERRLRFERLGIDSPDVRLMQDATGEYRLPSAQKTKSKTPDTAQKKEAGTPRSNAPSQEWTIDIFEINDGRIEGMGADGKKMWQAEGIGVKAKVGQSAAGVTAKGDAEIREALLFKDFTLKNVSTPFLYEADRLSLPKLNFVCYGGNGSGSVTFDSSGGRPFEAVIDAGGVDASSVIDAFGAEPSTVSGKITLHAEVSGAASEPDALRAKGNFAIQPAKLTGSSVLKTLGTILMLPELANSEFAAVRGQFQVADNKIIFSDLRTEPRERLQIMATGSIGFGGELDLKGMLAAKSETLNLAPLLARAGGTQSADGFIEVPFEVKGTTDNPRVSMAASTAGSLVGGFLQRLIGGKQKEKTQPDNAAQQPGQPGPTEEKPIDAVKRLLPFKR